MLDLALVLALSAECAPAVAPETMAAIAHAESRFNPLAIGVNGAGAVAQPATNSEAVREARRMIAAGASIDLGLAQINSANLARLRLTVEDAFDPCKNLAAAAVVLLGGYRPQGRTAAANQHALREALSRYNTGHPQRGLRNGYVARVEASARRLGLARFTSPSALPAPDVQDGQTRTAVAPSVAPRPWDVFALGLGGGADAFAPDLAQPSNRSRVP